ncbi:dihydrolipoamide acetyltransferase family protein [Salinifilum ghardaiensis]
MIKRFPLPDVGEGLTEAEVLGWRVSPGDEVSVNQTIVEIETAKATVELPCPWAGTVSELLAEPGQTVAVGAPIVAIDVAGEAGSEEASSEPAAAESASAGEGNNGSVATLVGYGPRESSTKRRPRKRSGAAGTSPTGPAGSGPAGSAAAGSSTAGSGPAGSGAAGDTGSAGVEQPPAAGGSGGAAAQDGVAAGAAAAGSGGAAPGRDGTGPAAVQEVPLAKPPVRKLARDLGVDLRQVTGSGAGGVITRSDVQAAAAPAAEPAAAAPESAVDSGRREHRVPVKGVRKATAQAMVDSAFTAPHVTEFLAVDVTELMRLRERLQARSDFSEVKLTPLAFAAKAVCLARTRTPDVNAAWDEQSGEIVYKDYVHLGIAAATPRGLVVPKVRDADRMSLVELARSVQELTGTARQGATRPEDMLGGTFTITNVGVFGVDTGTPIINPGESAILALGAVREMPWVVDGAVVPRQVCQLALSFDHRVVDGEQGSRFLADVGALLSDPGVALTY